MSKVILVTGANTGIGFELVHLLAEKGHTVYLGARNPKSGQEAEARLQKEGMNVKFVQLDVKDEDSIAAAKKYIETTSGHLNVLVNNAGASFMDKPQNATTIDMSLLRESFDVNFFGLVQTTIPFLPLLRKAPHSVILNVTTDMASNALQAKRDSLHVVAYNTPKAAVNSYTIALANDLKSEGIKVNCVTPGFTTTKLNNFAPGGKTPKDAAQILLPWALLGPDGPTGLFIGPKGTEMPW